MCRMVLELTVKRWQEMILHVAHIRQLSVGPRSFNSFLLTGVAAGGPYFASLPFHFLCMYGSPHKAIPHPCANTNSTSSRADTSTAGNGTGAEKR